MKRRILIELKPNQNLRKSFLAAISDDDDSAKLSAKAVPKLEEFDLDESFPAVSIPKETFIGDQSLEDEENYYDTDADYEYSFEPSASTYIVRGEVDDLEKFEKEARSKSNVVGIYSDPAIEPCIICPGSAPLGTDDTVRSLLKSKTLNRCGYNGKGVRVAIVDTGVNMAYLNSQGAHPNFDAANSWKPPSAPSSLTPGSAPVGHGTMCAFDVCISAPKCTILDIALLSSRTSGPTIMAGFLSDAILAYRHLINVQINTSPRPGVNKSLVVNNSWGMFHPSWDFPVGHSGNYSDNPNHPFNRIVRSLERQGADILFAAGNCGANCPDGRCRGVTTKTIYGANSSPYVLTIGGVDVHKNRVGYSSIGPGRLTNKKPDVCGYTHFSGSGVYSADGGTSAACPVVAGMVAAVRTRKPFDPANSASRPSAIRNFIRTTAFDLGPTGFDYRTGYGVINGPAILKKLKCIVVEPLCKRFPWICKPPYDFCRKYPHICFPKPRIPDIDPIRRLEIMEEADTEDEIVMKLSEIKAMGEYLKEFYEEKANQTSHGDGHEDCDCSK